MHGRMARDRSRSDCFDTALDWPARRPTGHRTVNQATTEGYGRSTQSASDRAAARFARVGTIARRIVNDVARLSTIRLIRDVLRSRWGADGAVRAPLLIRLPP